MYHLLRRLGPAEMLGPAECECLRLSSICLSLAFCSFTCLLNCIWPLKIFFMPFQMEDMKACDSVIDGCFQNSGSSSPPFVPLKRTLQEHSQAG